MMEFDTRLIAALTAVKNGDFSVRLPDDESGTSSEIATAFNALVEQMSAVLSEVNRLTTEMNRGRLGGQSEIEGLSGAWAETQDNINTLDLTITERIRRMSLTVELMSNGGRASPIDYNNPVDEIR